MEGFSICRRCLRRLSPIRVVTTLYLSLSITWLWVWGMFDGLLSLLMALGIAKSVCGIWHVVRKDKVPFNVCVDQV